jgi:hypothetical protein
LKSGWVAFVGDYLKMEKQAEWTKTTDFSTLDLGVLVSAM